MGVLRVDCPHCPATHVTLSIPWNDKVPGKNSEWNGVGVCPACGKPICFQAKRNGHLASPQGHQGEIEPFFAVRSWPSRETAVAPLHTPPSVAKRFLEGEDAYLRGSWNAAVAMYRSALDIATKGLDGVPAGSFYNRLKWLHENSRITPDMKAWADHVRIEGNEALHDPDDFEEADAKPLRLFTEMFLRYTFELPGEVKAFRADSEPDE